MRTRPSSTAPAFKDWHAQLFLLLAIAFFFRRILLGQAFLWEDFLLQVYPFRNFAAVSLAHGALPLWNPYAFGGMPFQADIQSALFYVPHLLLTPFVHHGVLSFYAVEVMLIAHYMIAASGMFALAREGGLARSYATFAALVYALSGFMIVHAIHPGFVEQAAWLPWIMLMLHRATTRRSLRYALLAGVLAGHAILAGAPQITLYLFGLIAGYAAYAMMAAPSGIKPRQRLHGAWPVAVTMIIALGIAAIQLLPTLELAPLSERSALTFDAAQAGRLDWDQLVTGIIPKFFGAHTALHDAYWGPGIYGTYWETCFYWGIPALLAGLFATTRLRRSARTRALVALVILSVLLAVGDQFILHRVLFATVPGFSAFRVPARVMLVATFAMALLGAAGLRAIVERATHAPRIVERAATGAFVAILLLWVGVHVGALLPANGQDYAAASNHEATIALLIAALTCVLAMLLTRRVLPSGIVVGLFLLLQLGDMTLFGQDHNTGTRSAETYYHERPEVRQLAERLQQAGNAQLFRVTSRDGRFTLFDRNLGMVDRLYLTEGYTPLRLRRRIPPAATEARSLDLLNAKYRVVADSAAGTMRLSTSTTYLPHAMWVPGDTVIADDSAAAVYMRRAAFDPRRMVVLSEALPVPLAGDTTQDVLPDMPVTLVDNRVDAFTVRVTAPRAGMLLLSEVYYPGWKATVDGVEQRVYRADWSLRAVPVTAGEHLIAMRFVPASFKVGAWISGITVLVVLAGLGKRPGDNAGERRGTLV